MSLTIRLDTRVSPDVHARFSRLAHALSRTKSNLIRTLIEERLTQHDASGSSVKGGV